MPDVEGTGYNINDEICANCRLRRGHHYGSRCPTAVWSGQFSLLGTDFEGTRMFRSGSEFHAGDPAIPMLRFNGFVVERPAEAERNEVDMDRYDEVCAECGLRFGHHSGGMQLCPPSNTSYDYDHGPGTVFRGTGVYERDIDRPPGTPAINCAVTANTTSDTICAECGNRRGSHLAARSELGPLLACPALPGEPEWSRRPVTVFRPVGSLPPPSPWGWSRATTIRSPRSAPYNRYRMHEVCALCGHTFGEHQMGTTRCPSLNGIFPGDPEAPVFETVLPQTVTPVVTVSPSDQWIMVIGQDGRFNDLCAAGVAVTLANIISPRALRGLAFPASDLERAARVIPVPTERMDTELETLKLAVSVADAAYLRNRQRAETATAQPVPTVTSTAPPEGERVYEVRLESSNGMDCWHEMEPVLREYTLKLKKDISAICFHGSMPWDGSQPDEGVLRLIFWGNAAVGRTPEGVIHMNYSIGGVNLSRSQRDGCRPSEVADKVLINEGGESIAEVVGNTLFVLFDLPHEPNAGKVLTAVLEKYMASGEAEKVDSATELQRKIDTLHQLLQGAIKGKIVQLNDQSSLQKKHITDYTTAVQNAVAALITINLQVEALEKNTTLGREKVANELESLLRLENVSTVRVFDNSINITTKYMSFMYLGKEYQGHSYLIRLEPLAGKITIKRADGRPLIRDTYCHPHVNSDGVPCWGNVGKGVHLLMGSMEFAALTQMLIEYLSVANEGDWFVRPEHWKRVEAPVEGATVTTVVANDPPGAPTPEMMRAMESVGDGTIPTQSFTYAMGGSFSSPQPTRYETCRTCGRRYNGNDINWTMGENGMCRRCTNNPANRVCYVCGLGEDDCTCWVCEHCGRRKASGDTPCPTCHGCDDCCGCWTCEGCGRTYRAADHVSRCEYCDRCENCCDGSCSDSDEEEDEVR